ncbi:SET domain-containing protein [Lophiostoma macrostomum CBS 122681]|uniref:SET domain-containing protein n=1 Tax=Lophiostoma macrostomum CBS 122681 TaxID=1314788 RepID=A0A6A6SL71_9PLEO|nr:SET domain-containing protein [Lophiostoma macrostomum CBS 122681]
MGVTASQPVCAIEDVPGKGKGLVATEDILKGTRITSEVPIIALAHVASVEQLHDLINQQVGSLNQDQQREFLSLHNIYPYTNHTERYHGIIRTNALPIGPDLAACSVFSQACRVNHACDHNATNFWNENINRVKIHAIRNIQKGEEITISYLKSHRNRQARQEELLRNFKFTCACRLCSLPTDQSNSIDVKLDRIHEIDGIIERGGVPALVASARRMLDYVDEQVRLWHELSANEVVLTRARSFAERLVPLFLASLGEDSPEVIQYSKLARDPTGHEYFGMSMKWKTAVNEIPEGLGPKDFEDWFWKRETDTSHGQLIYLRDREICLGFKDLPNQLDLESDYFEYTDADVRRPLCHWFFLGEIQAINPIFRRQPQVRDVEGTTVALFLPRDHRRELAESEVKKGNTVAILYAECMFGEAGIRIQDPQMMKIFPLSLDRLQNLSQDTQNGFRICRKCGKKGSSMKRCGRCLTFWYCDKVCQTADWIEEGHKTECKVLRDPDWQAMLRFNWDRFHGQISFPLHIDEGS